MEEKIYTLLDLIKKNGDAYPDYERIKELTPKILLNPKDIDGFLYALPECDYDISALEAVLLAVDGDVRCGYEGNGHAKMVLFHLYHDGEYEVLIHDRVVRINAPELKSRERYDAFLESDCPDHYMHVGDEDIVPHVFPPDAHDYMMLYLFGTNFGEDMYRYPVETVEDPSVKSFERAKLYLPTYVNYLLKKTEQSDCGMNFLLVKMLFEGYTEEEINEFALQWISIAQKSEAPCYASIYLYLFGECEFEYQETVVVRAASQKSMPLALSNLHTCVSHLCDVYKKRKNRGWDELDPDIELNKLAHKMRQSGFCSNDIEALATIWMQEMMKRNEAFYSLMYLRLFGEHFGGMRVNIDGIKDFDAAVELIPKYLDYLFDYRGFDDEYSAKFDPDCELYKLIVAMRKYGYSEEEINVFAMRWVNTVDALVKPCNSPIYVYLFNQFVFKHENFKLDLIENKKSFEQALCYLPKWVEYLTDMSVQYHNGYGEYDIFDLLIGMHNEGYEKEQIEIVLATFLDELERHIPREARHLARNLPHYAEKEPWLNECLPIFDKYCLPEDEKKSMPDIEKIPPKVGDDLPF